MTEQLDDKKRFHVGMRNAKTGLAVFLCLLIYQLIGRDGYFLACTSAIICMQDSMEKTVSSGLNRMLGTAFGALLGMLLLYLNLYVVHFDLTLLSAALGTMLFILLCNVIRKQDAIVIGCVVLLAIVLQQTDQSPFYYSVDRCVDTFFGIIIAILVNRFIRKPPKPDDVVEIPVEAAPADGGPDSEPLPPEPIRTPTPIPKKKGMSKMFADLINTIGFVENADPEVGAAMRGELERQRRNLELIASENIVSPAVMAAAGSVLTNKYAEGYPGKRYYGGCQCVDVAENLAIERAKELFGCNFANVQPHSGAQANEAVYSALLHHGDTVLGMNLAQGGHLTHGSPVNFSGINYNIVAYGVDSVTHRIDYDEVRRLALGHKPKMIIAGASAYPREIDFAKFSEIAKECGAYLFVDMAHIAGLVAAGLHISPIPYADVVTTTTHKTLRGIRGGAIFTNDEDLAKKVNKAVFPGTQGGPLMHVIAAKAVGFGEALQPAFKEYQQQVVKNAAALADALKAKGFDLVSDGTDNHLILVDLTKLDITGKELEHRLDEVYITVNKNSIPNETRSPFVTSGIRIGTPAVTTRGLKEDDMAVIADCMYRTATDFENQADAIRADVTALCSQHPLYE